MARPKITRKLFLPSLRKRARRIGSYALMKRINRQNKVYALQYIEKEGRIPKLDSFMSLKQGNLVKTISSIETARLTKPGKRDNYKNWDYLQRILVALPKGTEMMFVERHNKFPEFYQFCPIGGTPVWIDISEHLSNLSIMRPPPRKKDG